MPKLQKIVRNNQSEVYSVNLPKEVIEKTSWKKGDELNIECDEETNKVTIEKKDGRY